MRAKRALCLAAAFAIAACEPARPRATLAVAVPLSGDLAADGRGIERAVRLAAEQARGTGRLPAELEVRAYDDRADTREASAVASAIVSDPSVFAVVGHLTSGCSIEA